jgi:hypothetical protein
VLCVVYTVHVKMRSACFLVEPQNRGRRFVSGLTSKPLGRFLIGLGLKTVGDVCEWFDLKITRTGFTGLASKPVATVSGGLTSKPTATVSNGLTLKAAATVFSSLASKLVATIFSNLTSKLVVTVSWFGPQNQVGFSLSVVLQNRRREVGAGHVSRSSDLLHVEVSLARVFQSGLKTEGGATTGGARGTIAEVASEAS